MSAGMMKYLFYGITAFMALILTLRFLDRIPLWGWILFCIALGAVYWGYRKWRKF